jgi:intracellular sulfur oxidation DsrE/DsrF family protein
MLSKKIWLEQRPETRQRIANFLGLPKSGHCEVLNDGMTARVLSDGYTDDDLATITLEKLKFELGEKTLDDLGINKEDFYAMFFELVRRVELPVQSMPEPEKPKLPEYETVFPKEPPKPVVKKLDRRTKEYKNLYNKR